MQGIMASRRSKRRMTIPMLLLSVTVLIHQPQSCIATKTSTPELFDILISPTKRENDYLSTSSSSSLLVPPSSSSSSSPSWFGEISSAVTKGMMNDDDNEGMMDNDVDGYYHHGLFTSEVDNTWRVSPMLTNLQSSQHDSSPSLSLLSPLTQSLSSSSPFNNHNHNNIPKNASPLAQHRRHKLFKTGTTIVGCVADNGKSVIIGADTRATEGSIVADKRCEKVHRLSKNVWCCGAGTSADIDALVRQVRYSFLWRGRTEGSIGNYIPSNKEEEDGRLPCARVSAVCKYIQSELYSKGGQIGANLVLGGYEHSTQRAVLTAIHPHGSMDIVPYTALGSGGLAAMATLESTYHPDIKLEDAIALVTRAVSSGISNDLGSGSQIDLCVITEGGVVRYTRAVVEEEELVLMDGDVEMGEMLHERHSLKEEVDGRNGVNGFGSMPYAVKSRRVIVRSEQEDHEESRHLVQAMLGLD